MSQISEALAATLESRFSGSIVGCSVYADEVTIELLPAKLIAVATALRDEQDFRFEQLMDVAGVDYQSFGTADWQTSEAATSSGFSRGVSSGSGQERGASEHRFAAVYHLLSVSKNHRLRLRVWLDDEPPRVPSVVEIWSSADWCEREAFDMFGILFDGHPDLRRILTDYGFVGHPFRKDFPVSGTVEMRYDANKKRVVYEPVSIEPRTLVPKVIRHDHRFLSDTEQPAADDENADA